MSSKSISPAELAKRYAFALLQEAGADGVVDVVAKELNALDALNTESAEFHLLLVSSVVTKSERSDAMEAVAAKMELSDLTRRFLGVLLENNRASLLPKICKSFQKLRDERDGYIDVSVACATQPDDDVLTKLTETLASVCDKKIRLDVSVDASLIGGMTVRVGSALIDGSVKTKLQKLTQVMKGVGL